MLFASEASHTFRFNVISKIKKLYKQSSIVFLTPNSIFLTPLTQNRPWHLPSWRTTDDRLRGGSSHSYITAYPDPSNNQNQNRARFYGTLDITTLGGAGFASQFSPSPPLSSASPTSSSPVEQDGHWNLTAYPGITLAYSGGDNKTYTLVLKDSTPVPPSLADPASRTDGRQKAGVSWEANFTAATGVEERRVFFPWKDFEPTFRGRPVVVGDGEGVERGEVRKVGLMMRSGFGAQEGGFGVVVSWISAGDVDGESEKEDVGGGEL